jgi:hypothetical protein
MVALRTLMAAFSCLNPEFLAQALDGRERYAVGVERGDGFVIIAAEAESGVKVLRHRADVAAFQVVLVVSGCDRQGRDFLEHFPGIDRLDVGFGIAFAQQSPSRGAGAEKDTEFGCRTRQKPHSAPGAHGEGTDVG